MANGPIVAGDIFIAPIPTCPAHGRMKARAAAYVCVGWDGEGCDYQAADLELTPLGHLGADGLTFKRHYLNDTVEARHS